MSGCFATRPLACLLLALLAAGAAGAEPGARLGGIHYDPPRCAAEIAGIDHNGQAFTFSHQPHPLALVFFGYLSCTDVCPTNLLKMARVRELLGARADQVQMVFVTVDPEHEDAAVMKAGLAYYQGEIVGVTGSAAQLQPVYEAWGILRKRVARSDGAGYRIDHTAQVFLVQGHRRLRVSYPFGTPAEDIARDLLALLGDPAMTEPALPAVGEVRRVAIPAGAYTMAFQKTPTIPVYLRVWEGDSVAWRNDDYMYHYVGDLLLAPGDEATQSFPRRGTYYFLCTAVPDEALRVQVVAHE
jgi:protein SCO1/2